jgi:hypothetical protein
MEEDMIITLVVLHNGSGGRDLPHVDTGKITEVVAEGTEFPEEITNFGEACFWLQDNGFTPKHFQWLERPGLHRRRKCVYEKEDTHA